MMKRLAKSVAVLIGGFIAIATLYHRHVDQAREREIAQDTLLDADYEKRARQPLEITLLLTTQRGGMSGDVNRPSFQARIAKIGKLPVVLDLPGCGFPTWAKGVPDNVAMLTVDESSKLLRRKSLFKACADRDKAAIETAFKIQLNELIRYSQSASWIDKSRVMMTGSGEATPIVAAFSGPLKSRVTLGDPCVVRWSSISNSSPLLMLMTKNPQGIYDGPTPNLDRVRAGIANIPVVPSSLRCEGLPRPKQIPAKAFFASGLILATDRPESLMIALEEAYKLL